MTETSYPIVRLRPKANARAIRHGFPWVFANELVVDRRTSALTPGAIAVLEDSDRQPLGLVAVNPKSKIIARMLDRDTAAVIDQSWLEGLVQRALDHRARLYPTPHYRLIHAEADGLPGLVVDRFDDTLVVQPNAAWAEALLNPLVAALVTVTGAARVVKNAAGRTRALEGLDDATAILHGSDDRSHLLVPMNGATYVADLFEGQKTGLFFDQRDNHAFAARLGAGSVLDVFSHVGGFGLAALAAGADEVLCVDGSQPALDLAQRGAELTAASAAFALHKADAFDALETFGREGRSFDMVICDPPAFAPSKSAREAGLRAYERLARLAAPLVNDGGYLVLCSCSHAADLQSFRNASARGIGRGGRRPTLIHTGFAGPDHPQLPQLAETGYLKALFFRL